MLTVVQDGFGLSISGNSFSFKRLWISARSMYGLGKWAKIVCKKKTKPSRFSVLGFIKFVKLDEFIWNLQMLVLYDYGSFNNEPHEDISNV